MKTEPCPYCGAAKPVTTYVGEDACPGCGLVWVYDEGACPTMESIRALVAAERERCAKIADNAASKRGIMSSSQSFAAAIACEDVAARIRAGH